MTKRVKCELIMSQVVFLSGELSCDPSEKTKSGRVVALCEGITHTVLSSLSDIQQRYLFIHEGMQLCFDCLGVSGATRLHTYY